MKKGFATKVLLTIITLVVGAPTLPITSGTSAGAIFAVLAGIWSIEIGGE